jgi:aminocarboxymuconate-semialdehyde decarboxylase
MLHADTALFGARAARSAAWHGADRAVRVRPPFEPAPGVYIRETIGVIESLDLPDGDKERIYRGNAERLLKISVR